MDMHERTTAIDGPFVTVPSPKPLFGLSRRDTIVCRRCGGGPRTVSSRLADRPFFTTAGETGITPVRDQIPAIVASGGKINLRIYNGPHLEIDVPLSRARALLLAYDLIGALLPSVQLGDDPALSQESFSERVARILIHAGKGG